MTITIKSKKTCTHNTFVAHAIHYMFVLFFSSSVALAQHEHEDKHLQDNEIDEIIISNNLNKKRTETALPIHILNGEELRNNASSTLGNTIEQQLGVHSSSFGTGVGQPVIRGLTGNRVTVLQNDMQTLDAAANSADHANSVESLLSEQIEIIRGPASLIYGNNAIGGVVNTLNNRIPEKMHSSPKAAIELRHGTASHENVGVFKLDGSFLTKESNGKATGLAWHIDGLFRNNNNLKIPGDALDIEAIEALEHMNEHEDEEHGEEDEHLEELLESNTSGYIANSNAEADELSIGGSWIAQKGFLGFSFTQLNNNYGIPPGAHHHEEHHEEGEEELIHEDEEEHDEEIIRIDLKQKRSEIKTSWNLDTFFNQISAQLIHSEYEHTELEGDSAGTVYSNEGYESRWSAKHDGFSSGILGAQIGQRDFSAVGDEAFIPKSDIQTTGIFAMESFDIGKITLEIGGRIEKQTIDTDGACHDDSRSWSASIASIFPINQDNHLSASWSRGERSPSVEELFSNIDIETCAQQTSLVQHASTQRFEIGNPNLKNETSNNIEFGFYRENRVIHTEINLFYNAFNDYIYLFDAINDDEGIISETLQDDAIFYGAEALISFPITFANGRHLDIAFSGDTIRGELKEGDNLPRIPPNRLGIKLDYSLDNFSSSIQLRKAFKQDEISASETETEGYTRLDVLLDYHLPINAGELQFFAKGNNLTNEEIRDHTSYLKNFTTAGKRSFEIGMRWIY
ncbi:MAG: TonB-dependent receptor [Cellvibrionaceae bacterium]